MSKQPNWQVVQIYPDMHRDLKIEAARKGISLYTLVDNILRQHQGKPPRGKQIAPNVGLVPGEHPE